MLPRTHFIPGHRASFAPLNTMLRATASLALLCGAASVPVAERTVAFQHELALPSGLADSSLTALLAKAAGPLLDGDIQSVTFEAGTHAPTRRLQDTTSVTISYVINCGTTCSAISSQLASITSGGAAGCHSCAERAACCGDDPSYDCTAWDVTPGVVGHLDHILLAVS